MSFNPLTGISSILTSVRLIAEVTAVTFQSPDGDFVYSDAWKDLLCVLAAFGFNPLTGISSILTNLMSVTQSPAP